MAILKPKVWNSIAKHGSGERQNPEIFDPSRRDTNTALPRTRHFTRAQARISHASVSFTRSKIVFHCAALPCLVPGCRPVPSKIAASGARALLAMTESVGFSKKRYSFQNEMFEKRCRAAPHKKTAYNKKRPFSKQNRPNFVSLRGAQRRGNLKVIDAESRSEARERKTTKSRNFLIRPAGTPQRAPPLYSPARNVSGSSGWWLE